jgi:hypothetical protein
MADMPGADSDLTLTDRDLGLLQLSTVVYYLHETNPLLMATGTARRRGVVLILHDSSQPATTMGSDGTPKGLCKS